MSAQRAFGYFYGIHLHFVSENYNMLKYGTNTRASELKFNALTQPQRFKFQWLDEKFITTQDLVFACIAAELAELDIRYADKNEINDAFFAFKSRRESMTHTLTAEYNKYELTGEQPLDKLIFGYLSGEYSPEFILLRDEFEDVLLSLYESKTLSFARPKILKLIKYRTFFNTTKYLSIFTTNQNEDIITT